jgi:hypothetical protein
LAHPELKAGLTSQGIPQLHIDQLNTRFIMNIDNIVRQQAPKIVSGGVQHHWRFCKLTGGKLMLKTPEWNEWQQSEWLQLNKYYDQGMFGEPNVRQGSLTGVPHSVDLCHKRCGSTEESSDGV